ncbi:MAG TPA: hypothetical protein VIC03_04730 [Gemmatimonadaceae bacterium]
MKKVLTILVSLLIAAPIASPQSASRRATQADSLLVRHNIYKTLFATITLTPDQRARAQLVISDAERKSWAPQHYTTCAQMREWNNGYTKTRDSTLLAMLTNATDSAKFAARAATYIMDACPPDHP